MGIHGLAKLIADQAPSAIREQDFKNYFGRKIAIDASMCIYQFLIAVRQDGNVLQSEDGETTSHLMGMFYRTIRMLEHGIKPVYVFDGKPPQLKSGEFIDLCILLGCDYCGTIKGIGPKRAIDLIKQHGSIEEILENIDPNKHPAPDNWLYKEARELFLKPEVVDCSAVELKWKEPDEGELLRFMCEEKQFSEDRIRNGCKKIVKSRQGSTQGRLDAFFSVSGSLSSKRKEPEVKGSAKKKLKTGAAAGKFKKAK